jgi:hypothetical protein
MMTKIKAVLDSWIEKYASRKLIVWVTSTALLLGDKLNGDQWIAIALVYLGIQGAADIAAKWKGAGK